MKKKIVYGEITAAAATQAPDGMIAKIHFPTLAKMDVRTGDGRLLRSSGGGVRDLPQSVFHQFAQMGGHDGSVLVGRLDQVEFDTESGNVEGWGWLAATEDGRRSLTAIKTEQMRGNSVDLADVDVMVNPNFEDDFEEMEGDQATGFIHIGQMFIDFAQWNIAATTIVGTPAFAEASVEVEEEITAALAAGELITVEMPSRWTISYNGVQANVDLADVEVEITAATDIVQPIVNFRLPEPDAPTPFTVDENGVLSGHLGQFGECHTGVMDRCVMIPHSTNNYSHFLKKNVLTDEGLIPTGPIMLFGGHPAPGVLRPDNVTKVYGGVENTWADVTIVDGRFGPWISGMVRPGTDPEKVYAARASGLSGHWLNGDLYAIVSVNAEGYDVPRQFSDRGEFAELIASADVCDCNTDETNLTSPEAAWLALQLDFLLEDVDGDENDETEA